MFEKFKVSGRAIAGATALLLGLASFAAAGSASATPGGGLGEVDVVDGEATGQGADADVNRDADGSTAEAARQVYDNPGHVDVESFVDTQTGESYEVRSGVTHWEEVDPGSVVARSRSARALASYSDVFTITGPKMVPGGEIAFADQQTLRVEMDIPSSASAGDQYTLRLNGPLYWRGESVNNREVKDANGKVFAVVERGVEWSNQNGAYQTITVTLTDAVDAHVAIQGFFEARINAFSLKVAADVTANVYSPGGAALGPGVSVKTMQVGKLNGYSHSNGALENNRPALVTAVNVSEDVMRYPFTFTVAPQTPGTTSLGCAYAKVQYQGYASNGYWSTKQFSVPNVQCVVHPNGSMTLTVPTKITNTTGLTGGQFRFDVRYVTDKPGANYVVAMSTNIPASAHSDLAAGWTGTIISGVPVDAGADHLSLTTKKTASFTTQNGDAKPTVGDVITYTITTAPAATNDRAIMNLVTLDKLPEGLEFVSATNKGVYNSGSREIVWGPRTLTSTGKFTDTVKAKITAIPTGGSIKNTVENTAEEVCTDGDDVSVCDSTVTTPVAKPGFEFTKSSTLEDTNNNGWLGDAGDSVVYQFTVKNTGETTLSTAKFSDDLLGITDQECLTAPLKPGATTTCAGEYKHVITEADVEAGEVVNHATMCVDPALGLDCEPGETTEKTIDPAFDFTKSIVEIKDPSGKVITGGKAAKGDIIHFGFNATNTGNVDITSLLVNDPMLGVKDIQCLPEGFVLEVGKSVDCTDNVAYKYTVTAADVTAGKVHNIATGQVPGLPERPGETTTPILPDPTRQLAKTGAASTWVIAAASTAMLLGGIYVRIRGSRFTGRGETSV